MSTENKDRTLPESMTDAPGSTYGPWQSFEQPKQCNWIIGIGQIAKLCPRTATHVDPSTGSLFCETHAEDYEEVFGVVLHTLSAIARLDAAENGEK